MGLLLFLSKSVFWVLIYNAESTDKLTNKNFEEFNVIFKSRSISWVQNVWELLT